MSFSMLVAIFMEIFVTLASVMLAQVQMQCTDHTTM
jgi:hypothetical protein